MGLADIDKLKGMGKRLKVDYLTVGSASIFGNHYEVDARTVNINSWLIVHSTGVSSYDVNSASVYICKDAFITLTLQDVKDREKESPVCAAISVYKFIDGVTAKS